jgi:hypothetical protein
MAAGLVIGAAVGAFVSDKALDAIGAPPGAMGEMGIPKYGALSAAAGAGPAIKSLVDAIPASEIDHGDNYNDGSGFLADKIKDVAGNAPKNATHAASGPTKSNSGWKKPPSKPGFVGALPKPPRGPGKVPKNQRDPRRGYKDKDREAKRAAQNNKCATGCGTTIDETNSNGHHVDRHADGAPTVDQYHAEVCKDCHKELHRPD